MSLVANIDHLFICAGIEAVAVVSPQSTRVFRGQESWGPVLDTALNLFALTNEPSIRMVVGNHTLLIQREGTETVAVVLPTGHPIAKSLRRMIRRMSRKDRSPLTAEQVAEKRAEAQAAALHGSNGGHSSTPMSASGPHPGPARLSSVEQGQGQGVGIPSPAPENHPEPPAAQPQHPQNENQSEASSPSESSNFLL